ncbi:zinc-finger homeodomain protein 3-like [Dendrobium catenatum]|uniref:ZF-HD homeobox protein n=1 Tax=Dendrobium catenatum TaxID=906689 RepID=A0A2I0XDJ8_9ASPA|nr:zinc-finger homeodomain protein 3-like [Dendrobium catenatum]PKU85973.1 ZF-HD homeobox protein [Dendrobium catenatum]
MDLSVHEGEIPIPISSNYVGGSGSHIQSQSHNSLPFHHHHPSNVPSLPLQTPTPLSSSSPFNSKKTMSVKYRECLKNHAASIGGNATDGCGEFMPSGEEGTLEALKCSACNCHRNFHRKEIDGDQSPSCAQCFNFKEGRKFISHRNAFGYNPTGNNLILSKHSPHNQMIIPFSSMQTSESDEMEGRFPPPMVIKKRFRTKFTTEQKDKMLCFAEKVGWKLQKQEESVVQELCNEIGVKRRVLKVWMHNNKHNLAKKTSNLQLE